MKTASKRTLASRQKRIDQGWAQIHGLITPEAAQVARAMVEQRYASSMIDACRVALLRMVQEDSKK